MLLQTYFLSLCLLLGKGDDLKRTGNNILDKESDVEPANLDFVVGCPVDLNLNVKDLPILINGALKHVENERDKVQVLVEVTKVQRQIVVGIKHILTLKIASTTCSKKTLNATGSKCPLMSDSPVEYCKVEYFEPPWINKNKNIISNNCTKSQHFTVTKDLNVNAIDSNADISFEYSDDVLLGKVPCNEEELKHLRSKRSGTSRLPDDDPTILALTKRQVNGGRITILPVNDRKVIELVNSTLQLYDDVSKENNKYKVEEITSAYRQRVEGTKYVISLMAILSTCAKNIKTNAENCHASPNAKPKSCDVIIWDRPWLKHGRQTNISCDGDEIHQFRSRRSVALPVLVHDPATVEVTKREAFIGGKTKLPVNDPDVIWLSYFALQLLDGVSKEDKKQKVKEILSAYKQIVAGEKYDISLKAVLTNCGKYAKINPKDCTALPGAKPKSCKVVIWNKLGSDHARETNISCDGTGVHVFRTKGNYPGVKIENHETKVTKREAEIILGGREPLKVDDPKVIYLAYYALHNYDTVTDDAYKYKVENILSAYQQVVQGMMYGISLTAIRCNCLKKGNVSAKDCENMSGATPIACDIRIWHRPWLKNAREMNITCDGGKPHHFSSRVPDNNSATVESTKHEETVGEKRHALPSDDMISFWFIKLLLHKLDKKKRKRPNVADHKIGPRVSLKVDDPKVIDMAYYALFLYDSVTDDAYKYKVENILSAYEQAVQGIMYGISFTAIRCNCLKKLKVSAKDCENMSGATPIACDISIFSILYRAGFKRDWNITCDGGKTHDFESWGSIDSPVDHPATVILTKREAFVGGKTKLPVNDPDVIWLSYFALQLLDGVSKEDKKQKVKEILSAYKQIVAGEKYDISLKAVLTNCGKYAKINPKDCTALPGAKPKSCKVVIWNKLGSDHARETNISCDGTGVHVFRTNGNYPGIKVENHETKVTKREADLILGGREPLKVDDPKVIYLAYYALHNYDTVTDDAYKYKVENILSAYQQVVQGMMYGISLTAIRCNCLKKGNVSAKDCENMSGATPIACDIRIWYRPWLKNAREMNITCDGGKPHHFSSRVPDNNSATVESTKYEETVGEKRHALPFDDMVSFWFSHLLLHKLNKNKQKIPKVENHETKVTKREADHKVGDRVSLKVNDPKVIDMAYYALNKYDTVTDDTYKYKVENILSAYEQVVAGFMYGISLTAIRSNCLKKVNVSAKDCENMSGATPIACDIRIWHRSWLKNRREMNITCDGGKPHHFRSKRNVVLFVSISPVSTDDPIIAELTENALKQLDKQSNLKDQHRITEIVSATRKVSTGVMYTIDVKVVPIDCHKNGTNGRKECASGKDTVPQFCRIKVWDRPWSSNRRETNITCGKSTSHKSRGFTDREGGNDFDAHLSVFSDFKEKYRKYYQSWKEESHRFRIFRKNLAKIEKLNVGERGTAVYGVTKFADLTYREFSKKRMGLRHDLHDKNGMGLAEAAIPDIKLPTEFDWRKRNAVTEVKDQKDCGSCWAFSVTGNVEGQYAIKHKKLMEFSEQELIDCDKYDDGCRGGLMNNAYRAIEKVGGLGLESDYPYDAQKKTCHFNRSLSKVQISGAINISHNENDMAKWLVQHGPISISINANAMQFYLDGISHPLETSCNPRNLDHGALIVGYGEHTNSLLKKTLPFWIVKNSWGKNWGEQGYYRVYRGDGTCGLNKTPSSAILF